MTLSRHEETTAMPDIHHAFHAIAGAVVWNAAIVENLLTACVGVGAEVD